MAGCATRSPSPTKFEPAPPHADIGLAPPREFLSEQPPSHKIALERPEALFASLFADPTPMLRWPLSVSTHPELEPSFAIAAALAEPGLGWIDLCKMGAQNRTSAQLRELTAYLRGWCLAAEANRSGAISVLVPLMSAATPKLATAVRTDVISILAAGSADDAERLMTTHRLITLDRLDDLAATFVELGKDGDAYVINRRALESDRGANRASSCRRLARSAMLAPPEGGDTALSKLASYVPVDDPDPICVELYAEVACWLAQTKRSPRESCAPYWSRNNLPANSWGMVAAARHWPSGPAAPKEWFFIARSASESLEVPGADEVATRALEAMLRGAECVGSRVNEARTVARTIVLDPKRTGTVDARLRRILDTPLEVCASK
jgi:hypothetical protein